VGDVPVGDVASGARAVLREIAAEVLPQEYEGRDERYVREGAEIEDVRNGHGHLPEGLAPFTEADRMLRKPIRR